MKEFVLVIILTLNSYSNYKTSIDSSEGFKSAEECEDVAITIEAMAKNAAAKAITMCIERTDNTGIR